MRIFRVPLCAMALAFCIAALLGASAGSADVVHLIGAEATRVAAVSSHADGGFTVAWTSGAPLDSQVLLQRFDAAGAPSAPILLVAETLSYNYVRVSTDAAGNDLVIWEVGNFLPHSWSQLVAAAFSSSGEPLWGPSAITPVSGIGNPSSQSLSFAPSPAGGWIAAWIEAQPLHPYSLLIKARRLDPVTGASAAMTLLDPALHPKPTTLALGGSATRMLLAWAEKIGDGPDDTSTYKTFGQLLDGEGQPAAPIRELGVAGIGRWAILDLTAAGFGQDRFFVAWNSKVSQASPRSIGGLAFHGDAPVGSPFVIRASDLDRTSPLSLGVDGLGRAILGWHEETSVPPFHSRELLYRFAVNGAPLSGLEEVSALPGFWGTPAAVSAAPDGHWVAVWPRVADASAPAGIDALLGLSVDGCIAETNALCLTGNRFRVTASYHDHLGRDGVGYASQLTSESGTFWFFSPESVELIVKVVDACSHPDFRNFWVFASGLTDVQVHLEVVDTWTGATWERDTALGEPFPPALDTSAFDTCAATPLF